LLAALALASGCGKSDTEADKHQLSQAERTQLKESEAQAPERAVEERVLARWKALIEGDYRAAHKFISPGMRSLTPFEYYRATLEGGALQWKAVDITSVECEDGRCTVDLKRTDVYVGMIQAMVGQETVSDLSERWIESDGKWWFVPKI
jgi:hypothetical protein